MKPKIKYDPESGSAYIKLSKENVWNSLNLGEKTIIVDYDQNGDIVGIEVLDFKKII